MKLIAPILVSVFVLGAGLALGLLGRAWPELPGAISESRPETALATIDSVGEPVARRSKRRTTYLLPVAYHFDYDGSRYTGNRIGRYRSLVANRLRKDELEQLRAVLSPSGTVRVCFDPADPARSYIPVPSLDARSRRGIFVLSGVSGLFTLLGAMSLADIARKQLKRRPRPGDETGGIPRQPLISRETRR